MRTPVSSFAALASNSALYTFQQPVLNFQLCLGPYRRALFEHALLVSPLESVQGRSQELCKSTACLTLTASSPSSAAPSEASS